MSNLFKRGSTHVNSEEKRVIDSNALIEKTINRYTVEKKLTPEPTDEDGFSKGLSAEVISVLTDEEGNPINGETPVAAPVAPVYEGPTPEELVEQAKQEIEVMKEEAKAALSTERHEVLETAKKAGYQEGLQKATAEADAMKDNLKLREKELEDAYEQKFDELEPKFIDTLTGIYEHIFNVELSGYRDLIVYLIGNTLRKVEGGQNIIVHVSKEDYPYVSMQKKQMTSGVFSGNASVEIVEDITLSKNQAMIETENGIFDCSLGTQLSELGQKIKLLSYEGQNETE